MTELIKDKLYFRPVMGPETAINNFDNLIIHHECVEKSKDFSGFYSYRTAKNWGPHEICKSVGSLFPSITFFGFYYGTYMSQILFHQDEYRLLSHHYVYENEVPLLNQDGVVIGVGKLGKIAKNGIQSVSFDSGHAAWIMDVEKTKEMRMPTQYSDSIWSPF